METDMKTRILLAAAAAFVVLASAGAAAQGASLTASQILDKVDEAVNGPKDQSYTSRLVLTDKNGGQKVREMVMLQKGRDRRLVRFLSPADQRGIAFLSLPGNIQYVYLPAFGKVRRISSSVKNSSFAGTDFTYEDLEAARWSDKWDAKILGQEQGQTILEMALRPGMASGYSRLVVRVLSDTFYPVRIEHYDRSGQLAKVLVREDLRQMNGYWVSMLTRMEDVRTGHKTEMTVSDVRLDTGVGDEKFSERYLAN
jgi:outer membrane lipoprotein-sorting protein